MMKLAWISLTLAVAACGASGTSGSPHPQIASVVYAFSAGEDSTTWTTSYAYKDSKLLTKTVTELGSAPNTTSFIYTGDEITGASNATNLSTTALGYANGQITSVTTSEPEVQLSISYTYEAHHLATANHINTVTGRTTTGTTTYANSNGRLVSLTDTTDVYKTSIFTYDQRGRLASDNHTVGLATPDPFVFAYDSKGRVSTVTNSVGTETVTYGTNNFVSTVLQVLTGGSSTATYTYTYNSGELIGFVATPPFTDGFLFSMDGKLLDRTDYLTDYSYGN